MRDQKTPSSKLEPTLGPWLIWGLGVGYVISGMYCGWNLGLIEAGPYGFAVAAGLVTIMYVAFVFNYAELTCALPRAGGAFIYAERAFGSGVGFLAGLAQWIEFTFAPPAIAAAIGAYFSLFFEGLSPTLVAIIAYMMFTGLNIWGVKMSAIFELCITAFAVVEILIFSAVTLPHFSLPAFSQGGFQNGVAGIFRALPFAIWFFLAIEAVANIAEESKNPERDLSRGFMLAMGTLVLLAILVFFGATGVNGYEAIVYTPGTSVPSDSPLPLAMGFIVGENSWLYHLLISIGIFGLVASFHGIILASGRALFELGRAGMVSSSLGRLSSSHTPKNALVFNMGVGIIAILSGETSHLITLAVFGALLLYIISMASQLRLRVSEPNLKRPFRAPLYPFSTFVALGLALVCFVALFVFNTLVGVVFVLILATGALYYRTLSYGRTTPLPLRSR
jgi:ethanolamine permease